MKLMSSQPDNIPCDWVALSFVTGVGSRTAAMLIDRFGSPTACFEASRTSLESFGLKREAIDAIKSSEPRERALQQLEDLARISGEVIVLDDERYPALLRETYDPPIALYVRGDLARAIGQPAVAIVALVTAPPMGATSRRCSRASLQSAASLSSQGSRAV